MTIGNHMAKRKLLTVDDLTALDAGADITDPTSNPEDTETSTLETSEITTLSSTETEAPAPVSEAASLVDYLKTQLADAQAKQVELTVENKHLQSKLDQMSATHAEMRTVVCDLTNNRRRPLNIPAMDMTGLSDEAVMQQFHQVTATYLEKFPVGGRAAPPSTAQTTAAAPAPGRLSAVKPK